MRYQYTPIIYFIFLTCPQGVALDENGDGMSDVWAEYYSVVPGDRLSDLDGDGYSNFIESQFRTNPNLNGAPGIGVDMHGLPQVYGSDGIIRVSWTPQQYVRYRVEHSYDKRVWTGIGGASAMIQVVAPVSVESPYALVEGQAQYFRVIALPPLDFDGDGLDLWEEGIKGTSDLISDTDGDGVSDGAEVAEGLDPTLNMDDGDGIPDDWELLYFGSIDAVSGGGDLDADGLTDSVEFSLGLTDASVADSDGDGINDGFEVESGEPPGISGSFLSGAVIVY